MRCKYNVCENCGYKTECEIFNDSREYSETFNRQNTEGRVMNAADLTNRLQNICHDGHAKKRVTVNGHRVTSVKITDDAVEIATDERRPETCGNHFQVPDKWEGCGEFPNPIGAVQSVACHRRLDCRSCRFYVPKKKLDK